jgi:hypothetical protein
VGLDAHAAGPTTPESVLLPALVVPTVHVNSVPVADGELPVLNPWMYTLSVIGVYTKK